MKIQIKRGLYAILGAACGVAGISAHGQTTEEEITALRARVEQLEQQGRQNNGSTTGNRFNPAIGVIFSGTFWHHGEDLDNYLIQGYPFAGEAGPIEEGFTLGETEVGISANVDDKFTAWLTLPIAIEDGEGAIEIEEAWLETTALPAGFSLRFGRFFSGIGYLNGKHAHTWDFADQPLPYQVLLGDQYLDDGLQLRWLAPTDVYMELGAEVLRGDRFPSGGGDNSGHGSSSVFANVGGDIGRDSSWLAGLSFLRSSSVQRPSGDEDVPLLFDGDTDTVIAHLVWKWAPNGNWKQRNASVQAEIIKNDDDGIYTLPGGPALAYDNQQRGWYVQGVYQPKPRWRFGIRYDQLSGGNPGAAFIGSDLEPAADPKRYSLMVDWSNSEFSRLRFQYTRDQAGLEDDNQFGLQYIFSIGAHGAHTF